MHKQGNPDGPNSLYAVHIMKPLSTDEIIRDRQLGKKTTEALCLNGGYHKWFASKSEEITCPRCKEIAQSEGWLK